MWAYVNVKNSTAIFKKDKRELFLFESVLLRNKMLKRNKLLLVVISYTNLELKQFYSKFDFQMCALIGYYTKLHFVSVYCYVVNFEFTVFTVLDGCKNIYNKIVNYVFTPTQ